MNHLHLQEAAKHYAKLAEEAQAQLQEEQELNEGLIGILDVLCEELGIDMDELLETTFSDVVKSRGGDAAIGRAKYLKDLLKIRQERLGKQTAHLPGGAVGSPGGPIDPKIKRVQDLLRKHGGIDTLSASTTQEGIAGHGRFKTGQISPTHQQGASDRLKDTSPARIASAQRREKRKTGVADI